MISDFDLGVEIECAGKLIAIHNKYGHEEQAEKELNKLYGRLLLMYEGY
jgi:hypothetical protein